MILCGWCGKATTGDRCSHCGHADPERPWVQRGEPVPVVRTDATGRPSLDARTLRRRLDEAREALGPGATVERLAEHLDVSPKTVRRWQKVSS